jgi:hypothetical protein
MKFAFAFITFLGSLATAQTAIKVCGEDFSTSKQHKCFSTGCKALRLGTEWSCYRCDKDITQDDWDNSEFKKKENKERDLPYLRGELKKYDEKLAEKHSPETTQKYKTARAQTAKRIEETEAKHNAYQSHLGTTLTVQVPKDKKKAAEMLVDLKKKLEKAQEAYRAQKKKVFGGDVVQVLTLGLKDNKKDEAKLAKLKAAKNDLKQQVEDLTVALLPGCVPMFHKTTHKQIIVDRETKSIIYFSKEDMPAPSEADFSRAAAGASHSPALVRRTAAGLVRRQLAAALVMIPVAIIAVPLIVVGVALALPGLVVGGAIALVVVAVALVIAGIIGIIVLPFFGIAALVGR